MSSYPVPLAEDRPPKISFDNDEDNVYWAQRTERELVYDIVKHNHELYSQRAVISERLGPETTLASSYMGV
jgi:hypothetical protein